ncbi:MAG: transcription elongation factor GreA [Erysipelotrichaceae bacterium]|nr:transcription elongation factor GreA [Erysipelotrichaceae bacterium]MBR3167270.1 transcription elongation factor GreA [Erysipelotrichaceae bacterium]
MDENKEKNYITEEGLQNLKNELNELVHVIRPEVIEELKAARAQGDLSENADYDAARDRQAQVESRIKELEHMIRNAEVISSGRSTKFVRLGSTVEIKELDTGNVLTYTIVGTVEADPLSGRLSNVTPLAEAILNKKVGETVTVKVDEPYEVLIVSVH